MMEIQKRLLLPAFTYIEQDDMESNIILGIFGFP